MDGRGKLQALYRDVVPVSQSSQKGVGGVGFSSIFLGRWGGGEVEEERVGYKKLQTMGGTEALLAVRCLRSDAEPRLIYRFKSLFYGRYRSSHC